jgi:DNA-binding MarR family transcriptional regulator
LDTGLKHESASDAEAEESMIELARSVRVKLHAVLNSSRLQSQALARHTGIGASQLLALGEINRNPGIRIGEFAHLRAIKSSTASNLLDKLEQRGWVRRERSGPDQRVVRLYLTAAGKDVLDKFPVPTGGVLDTALSLIAVDTLAALDRGLGELITRLDQNDGDSAPAPIGNP